MTAVLSGCVTLLGVLIANSRTQAVAEAKLAELTREVREMNELVRQMPVLEEHMRGVDRRLEKLEHSGRDRSIPS